MQPTLNLGYEPWYQAHELLIRYSTYGLLVLAIVLVILGYLFKRNHAQDPVRLRQAKVLIGAGFFLILPSIILILLEMVLYAKSASLP